MPRHITFAFPGQGSQYLGMLDKFKPEEFDIVKEEIDKALGFKIFDIVKENGGQPIMTKNDHLYAMGSNGNLFIINKENGTQVFSKNFDAKTSNSLNLF